MEITAEQSLKIKAMEFAIALSGSAGAVGIIGASATVAEAQVIYDFLLNRANKDGI